MNLQLLVSVQNLRQRKNKRDGTLVELRMGKDLVLVEESEITEKGLVLERGEWWWERVLQRRRGG